MSDIAVRARDLRKVYRLYTKPLYRFLDMFGMLGGRSHVYSEHAALDGLSLDIRRGEKVAIIGRNGAGKSTFLKLVTSIMEPTSGSIEVHGKVHALLQIGTGFHPDFTGRENVYAYLAQLGVAGREADRLCAEIIDFAEVETYIDQPVKTYSTGMGVRLMFATSTAITPDLLVLDEVLGVGDAYFAHKSFHRMRELCEREGTTLLLVTHDIYSAIKLCPRVVWIDRGRIVMDGDGAEVVKAYEDSIRQQEEQRLRLKTQTRLEELEEAAARTPLVLELSARHNEPQPDVVYVARIDVSNDTESSTLPIASEPAEGTAANHLITTDSAWGAVTSIAGRSAREFLNFGTVFHKVAGVAFVKGGPEQIADAQYVIEIDYYSASAVRLVLSAFAGERSWDLGELPATAGTWQTYRAALRPDLPPARNAELNASGRAGSGVIAITDVAATDGAGKTQHHFQLGAPLALRMRYRIRQPDFQERSQVLIAIHRDGVEDVCRFVTRDLLFDAAVQSEGIITLELDRLMLANGTYTVTVLIAKEGYYDASPTLFYSINPDVYSCASRVLEFVVEGGGIIGSGTKFVGEGRWRLTPVGAPSAAPHQTTSA